MDAIEYSRENRFPFHSVDRSAVTVCFDNHEDMYELDFIWNKIVERFPLLEAEPFYLKIHEINSMKRGDKIGMLKDACDNLLRNIRDCIQDEEFIHMMHDKWGFGID